MEAREQHVGPAASASGAQGGLGELRKQVIPDHLAISSLDEGLTDVEDVTLTLDVGGDELTRHALAGGEGRSETIGADSLVLGGLGSARQPLASASLAPRVLPVAKEAHADVSVL